MAVDTHGRPIPPSISRGEIVRLLVFCVVTIALVVAAMFALVAVAESVRWTCWTDCSAGG